jgi:Arabinose efflux permease
MLIYYVAINQERGGNLFLKKILKPYSGLPRSVYIIFAARVVNCMGNFVFPFMTLLLTTKVGMSEDQAGLFLLIGSALQVPGSLIGGKLADHMGRKQIMILFMGLASLCFVPCAFLIDSPSTILYIPYFLIMSSFLYSVSNPAGGAMMNDLTTPENRQSAFSLLYMGINIGAAVGSLVAGLLFNNYMKLLFLGDTATTLIAIVLLLKYVEETKPTEEDIEKRLNEQTDEKAESVGLFAALFKRPELLIFVLLDTIYSFVYAQTHFSLPLHATAVFGKILGPKYFSTFNAINCLEVILCTTIFTTITKKIRAIYNVSFAGVFFAVGFGMLFFVKSYWMYVLSTIIWTVGEIVHATNTGVYIANHTPVTHRGRFNSIINIISGTGGAISPYIMGGFIAKHGVNNSWPVVFIAAMTAAILMFVLGTHEKRKIYINNAQEAS